MAVLRQRPISSRRPRKFSTRVEPTAGPAPPPPENCCLMLSELLLKAFCEPTPTPKLWPSRFAAIWSGQTYLRACCCPTS